MECKELRICPEEPVVGCEVGTWVRVVITDPTGKKSPAPAKDYEDQKYSIKFTWWRELSTGGVQVGSSKTYTPSELDCGLKLRVTAVVVTKDGVAVSPEVTCTTAPVIRRPQPDYRIMVLLRSEEGGPKSMVVVSYNIMADSLRVRQERRSHCPNWALSWTYRRENLLTEISSYRADIICLQEIQSNHHFGFFSKEFNKLGYSSVYTRKMYELRMGDEDVMDGCAIYFRRDRFRLVAEYKIKYAQCASRILEKFELDERLQVSRRLMKDNVAAVALLEEIDGAKSKICIANTHLYRGSENDSEGSDVRLFQVSTLLNGLEKFDSLGIPVIVCGDFNSMPTSETHQYIISGKVEISGQDLLGIKKQLDLSHSLNLTSAYKRDAFKKRHPSRISCGSILDYMFYSGEFLSVEGLLEPPDYGSMVKRLKDERLLDPPNYDGSRKLFPSPLWSSDHLALGATFRRTVPSKPEQKLPSTFLNPWQ